MSAIHLGIIIGVIECAKALTVAGAFLKSAFNRASHGNEELRAEQERVHAELEHCLLRPQSVPLLRAHVQALAEARTVPAYREAAARVSAALHAEQEAIALQIAPLVTHATQLTSFPHVQQLQSPGRILIVGQGQGGKALQTELLTSPGQPLAIRSEMLGCSDGTCDDTLTQFQEHLAAQGVTITTTRRTRTLRQRLRSRVGMRQ